MSDKISRRDVLGMGGVAFGTALLRRVAGAIASEASSPQDIELNEFDQAMLKVYVLKDGTEKRGAQILIEAINRAIEDSGFKIPTNFQHFMRVPEPRTDVPGEVLTWIGNPSNGIYWQGAQPLTTPSKSNFEVSQTGQTFHQIYVAPRDGQFQPKDTTDNDLIRMGFELRTEMAVETIKALAKNADSGDFSTDKEILKKGMGGSFAWAFVWDNGDKQADLRRLLGQGDVKIAFEDVNAGVGSGRRQVKGDGDARAHVDPQTRAGVLADAQTQNVNWKIKGVSREVTANGNPIPPKTRAEVEAEWARVGEKLYANGTPRAGAELL